MISRGLGQGGRRKVQEGGDVWLFIADSTLLYSRKVTQHCKAIIPPRKMKKKYLLWTTHQLHTFSKNLHSYHSRLGEKGSCKRRSDYPVHFEKSCYKSTWVTFDISHEDTGPTLCLSMHTVHLWRRSSIRADHSIKSKSDT